MRIMAAAFLAFCAGCAHMEAPRGGPPDEDPPAVISTEPAPDTVLQSFAGPVVFRFNERISERGLEETVIVSPRTSPVQISHGRDALRVALREGWLPGQIYHVILRPEVSDLFGNPLPAPVSLVFSTGPEIPSTESSGAVVDRITGERAVNVRVEAIRAADSLVYAVPTDTAGQFVLDRIPEGEYQLRAFEDVNVNRSLDIFEPRDSVEASIVEGEPVVVALRLLMPDSTPPVAASAAVQENIIEVQFDDYLDPEQEFSPEQAVITGPAGAVEVISIALETAMPETPDSVAVDQDQPVELQPEPAVADPSVAVDTTTAILPSRTLVLSVAAVTDLETAGEYVISFSGVRNVNGLEGESEVSLTVTAPAANAGDPRFRTDPVALHWWAAQPITAGHRVDIVSDRESRTR